MRAGAAGMPMRKGESRPTVRARTDAAVARAWSRPPALRLGIREPTGRDRIRQLLPDSGSGAGKHLCTRGNRGDPHVRNPALRELRARRDDDPGSLLHPHCDRAHRPASAAVPSHCDGVDRPCRPRDRPAVLPPASPWPDHHPRHRLVRTDADGALLRADRLGRQAPVLQQGDRPSLGSARHLSDLSQAPRHRLRRLGR